MKIVICKGKACQDRFCNYIDKRLNSDIAKFDLKNVIIEHGACTGACKKGPNISIDGEEINYCDPAKAAKIMMEKINNRLG
ncbi:MAG: NAD(P)H-dependent oxidoreductase subunit E [Candidatus Gracilibacteria bacterium]|nr:NAD(P)H-dependent oxidoreductase subunit E [Candidatus Gracilibacteria bacterium]